jgi:mRNA interferase MazF
VRWGEVWWAALPAPAGRRLVVLLSRDEAYSVRELVMVAPITTPIRSIPTEVPLGPSDGLPRPCVANLDTITTIPRRALAEPIGPLPAVKLVAVERALMFALGLQHAARRARRP